MKWFRVFLATLLVPLQGVLGVMKCSSLFGLETPLQQMDCSWEHPASYYIDELGKRGFNYLRVPFSGEYVRKGDFRVMDEIFDSAQKWDMNILLDWHRNINAYQDNWLENISLEDYFMLYEKLIDRYYQKPNLQMIGLFNEYKDQDHGRWKDEMDGVVRHLETKYPNRFYWLIGCPQWSGYCAKMDWSYLPFYDRVFVDHHKYIFSQPSNHQGWEASFYHDPAHSIVGEWGYFSDHPDQVQWAHTFVEWLKQKGIRNTCFWVSVSNSGDTGGLWKDCRVFEEDKYALLKDLWGEDNHRALMDNSSSVVMDEAGDDDEEDDWDDRRGLQGRWRRRRRRRKCHFLSDDLGECVKHRRCCANKEHGCWKCID